MSTVSENVLARLRTLKCEGVLSIALDIYVVLLDGELIGCASERKLPHRGACGYLCNNPHEITPERIDGIVDNFSNYRMHQPLVHWVNVSDGEVPTLEDAFADILIARDRRLDGEVM